MPRYIDAEVMPNDAFWEELTYKEKAKVLQYLVGMPTADVVEVVRCKDCKHKNPNGSKCLRDNLWHDSDDFCSYGERKE